jgi:hypothetical protein
MKLYSEHTVWSQGGTNHWYLLDDSRRTMYGYRRFGTEAVTLFRTPLPFYEKGRRLKLEHDFGGAVNTVRVEGSGGRIHTVTLGDRPSCSCESFTYRGHCKHIAFAIRE